MSATAAQYKAEFVVGLGDNFYQAGITGLDDPQIQEKYEVCCCPPVQKILKHCYAYKLWTILLLDNSFNLFLHFLATEKMSFTCRGDIIKFVRL